LFKADSFIILLNTLITLPKFPSLISHKQDTKGYQWSWEGPFRDRIPEEEMD
jgi:hypothetical protein